MQKYPMLDLHPTLKDCKIFLSAGEAGDSNCTGTLTIVITNVNQGLPIIIEQPLSNLGRIPQEILIDDVPKTGKVHKVVATMTLDSGHSKIDDELIKLCQ
jgi:hypothetical protein